MMHLQHNRPLQGAASLVRQLTNLLLDNDSNSLTPEEAL